MKFISDSIARCQVVESTVADASSYDVGSSASIKKILGEYPSRGCDSVSALLGMTRLVRSCIRVGWSGTETLVYAKSAGADSVLEDSATRDANLMFWVGPS